MGEVGSLPDLRRRLEILHEDHFVAGLVVDEFVDERPRHRESEPARPQSFLFANDEMPDRVVFRIRDRRIAPNPGSPFYCLAPPFNPPSSAPAVTVFSGQRLARCWPLTPMPSLQSGFFMSFMTSCSSCSGLESQSHTRRH